MKTKLLLCLALVLSSGLFGCSTVHSPSSNIRTEISGSIQKFHMVDANNGWIWMESTNGSHLLHTINGGQNWTDVTPPLGTNKVWDCRFPKAQLAWFSFYYYRTDLLLTTNAGKSWGPWQPLGDFNNGMHNFFLRTEDCRFFNDKDGLAEDLDVGTCQAEYNFFETHDGGLLWKPATIVQPEGNMMNELQGTIDIGDCDGSAVNYYPPKTIVIADGDLMDETPKGIVRLSVSLDAGKSWSELKLPLPEKYHDGLVDSFSPYFFDEKNAVLPVWISKFKNDDRADEGYVFEAFIFYRTTDGGKTWSLKPGILDFHGQFDYCYFNFISPHNFFVRHGADLFVTHDGAETWEVIKSNIDFRSVIQMEFLDAKHGWLVKNGNGEFWSADHQYLYSLTPFYKTSDGGKTWTEVPLKISQD